MSITLTSRGRVVVAAVLVAVTTGWLFGARSLNAVAAPLLVALLLGLGGLWYSDPPEIEVGTLDPGFPGEHRTLRISSGTGDTAMVTARAPAGIAVETETVGVGPEEPARVELELQERGLYKIGPIGIDWQDPLGLLRRKTVAGTATLVVYPAPYELAGNTVLDQLFVAEFASENQEFDSLREYTPGDPLRHVHWPSSAKYDEFVVAEYTGQRALDEMTVAGHAHTDGGELLARTILTLTERAFDAGLDVGVAVPGRRIEPGRGTDHRREVRRALATVDDGPVPPAVMEAADVAVRVTHRDGTVSPETTTVDITGEEYTLAALLSETRPRREVVP